MRTARISALRELVLQAPAPVIAEALGFHHTTTHRQHANAGGTWTHYPAGDHQSNNPRDAAPNTHHTNTQAPQSTVAGFI